MTLDHAARERAPRARTRTPARRREHRHRLRDRRGMRAQAPEERAEHARARLRVGERAVRGLDLDAERVGQRGEPALARERREAACEGDRAEHRRVGPRQVGARERLAQHATVERRVVGDEHARRWGSDQIGEVGQDRVRGRRGIDHLLRDLREALDRPRQRHGRADERLPAVVQLAAADEHRPDLRELAGVTGLAVRLRVDDEELGRRKRLGEQVHERMFPRPADDLQAVLQQGRPEARLALAPWCQRRRQGAT